MTIRKPVSGTLANEEQTFLDRKKAVIYGVTVATPTERSFEQTHDHVSWRTAPVP